MKQWLIAWALGQLIAIITKDEQAIVAYLNKKVDLPKLSEEQEAKLFTSILKGLKSFIQGR